MDMKEENRLLWMVDSKSKRVALCCGNESKWTVLPNNPSVYTLGRVIEKEIRKQEKWPDEEIPNLIKRIKKELKDW